MVTDNKPANIVKETESFIAKYATLARDYYLFPLALWNIATHTWPTFDCFPYLEITAFVKRAGKSRMMELCSKISANGRTFSADSTASMFRALNETKPTIFIDEAEKLNQENHPAREFLNKGYKRGQNITRMVGNEVTDFESYGPKCFALIGDVYDTLRDRCIVVTMKRRTPVESAQENKYRSAVVDPEAADLRSRISAAVEAKQADIESIYAELPALDFLNDRDEEIWTPLFVLCRVLCPERYNELVRDAVDIATEKTSDRRSYYELLATEEKKADDADAQILLLRDMLSLTDGQKHIATADLLERLKAIPTSPWRTWRGNGLTAQYMGYLLDSCSVHPKPIRMKSGAKTKQAIKRGYLRVDLVSAARLAGLVK
jgi:hypothetical protein